MSAEGIRQAGIGPVSPRCSRGVTANGGDEEIQASVAVEVEEDDPGRMQWALDAGPCGDVLEAAASDVAPEFVSTPLVAEEQIRTAVPIHVRHGEAGTVVFVNRLLKPTGVVGHLMAEGDAGLGLGVVELEPGRDESGRQRGALAVGSLEEETLDQGLVLGGLDRLGEDGLECSKQRNGLT